MDDPFEVDLKHEFILANDLAFKKINCGFEVDCFTLSANHEDDYFTLSAIQAQLLKEMVD